MNLAIKLLAGASIAAVISYEFYDFTIKIPPRPELEESKWWGRGEQIPQDESVNPYQIRICENDIQDLKHRLDNAKKFTPPLEGVQHQYGLNTILLKNVIDSLKASSYEWKDREQALNKLPHFMTKIQGLQIHFYHVKPAALNKNEEMGKIEIVPLLLVHGWPSSSLEFLKIIPELTKTRNGTKFAFEIIAPDIPGFGLSESAARPGLGSAQVATIFKKLMGRLGHRRFYVHGGDFGAAILRFLAVIYPESVLGYHSSMCAVNTPLSALKTVLYSVYPTFYVKEEHLDRVYPLREWMRFMLRETGYMHLQTTKPDTIGVALRDSPVGLAAYMLEKYITLSNFTYVGRLDGGLAEKYDLTSLFDNILLYWFSGCMSTSMRLYAETFNFEQLPWFRQLVRVPSACARFTYDIYSPDGAVKEIFTNLVHLVDYEGGHFPALLTPEVLVDDIFIAVGKFRGLEKFD